MIPNLEYIKTLINGLYTKLNNKADGDHTHDTYETKEDSQAKYDEITATKADSDDLDSVFERLDTAKQDKITGVEGQYVGFDTNGNTVAYDLPSEVIISDTEPTDETAEVWINTSEEWNDNIAGSAGGSTSWNDLTDKPFGVMEAIEGNFVYNDSTYSYQMEGEVPFVPPYVAGDTVKVIFDGTEYEFTAAQKSDYDGTYISFGHWGLIDYRMGSSSDVVLWRYNTTTGINEIYSKTGGMHTVSLSGVELVTPLDEKFLPTEVVKRSELPEFEVVFNRTGSMNFDTNMYSFNSDNLTINKTYDEIKAALDAGRRVVGILEEDRYTSGNDNIRIKLDVSMSTLYKDLYFMGFGMMFYGTKRHPCFIEFKVGENDAPSGSIYYIARPSTMA